jgi:hypothetical protein
MQVEIGEEICEMWGQHWDRYEERSYEPAKGLARDCAKKWVSLVTVQWKCSGFPVKNVVFASKYARLEAISGWTPHIDYCNVLRTKFFMLFVGKVDVSSNIRSLYGDQDCDEAPIFFSAFLQWVSNGLSAQDYAKGNEHFRVRISAISRERLPLSCHNALYNVQNRGCDWDCAESSEWSPRPLYSSNDSSWISWILSQLFLGFGTRIWITVSDSNTPSYLLIPFSRENEET